MTGFTSVSASRIMDASGRPLANGIVTFIPVDPRSGLPVSAIAGGGGGLIAQRGVLFLVVNGAITTDLFGQPAQVADTALTTPANIAYAISVTDASGTEIQGPGYGVVQPSGAGFDLDTYPTSVASLPITNLGPAGQSAYDAAVAGGFVGTKAAWLASLQGVAGVQGPQGVQGTVGNIGPQGVSGPLTFLGAWSSTVAYTAGQAVTWTDENTYVALQLTTNNTPGTSPTYWGVIRQSIDNTHLALLENAFTYSSLYSTVASTGTVGGTIGSSTTANVALALPTPIAAGGYLESISMTVEAPGTLEVFVLSPNGSGSFTVVDSFNVVAAGAGLQTFNAGVDYTARQIAAGRYVGIYSTDATVGFDGAGAVGYLVFAGAPPTTPTAWTSSSTGRLDFNVTVRSFPVVPVVLPEATQAEIDNAFYYSTVGADLVEIGTSGGTLGATTTAGVCLALPTPLTSGYVETITTTVSTLPTAGTITVFILQGEGATYRVVRSVVLTPTTTGQITFYAGRDFAPFTVSGGELVGIYSSAATSGYQPSGTAGYIYFAGAPSTSNQTWGSGSSGRIDLAIAIRSFTGIADVANQQIVAAAVSGPVLSNESFAGASLPAEWSSVSGAWTASNGLVSPTGSVGYGTIIEFVRFYSLCRRVIRTTFNMLAANSAIGIGSRSTGLGNPAQPSLVAVDGAANTLTIFESWTGGTPTALASVALPFSITVGSNYLLEIRCNEREVTATCIDPITGLSASVTTGNNVTNNALTAWGNFADSLAVVAVAGQFKVQNIAQAAIMPAPEVLFLGDSITYGMTVTVAQRWASIVGAQLPNQSYLVSGRPGGASDGALERVRSEAQHIKPKTLVLMIGTNDLALGYGVAEVQANVLAIIAACQNYNIALAICCLTQMTADLATVNTYNAWLLTLPAIYPQVSIVRFDLATTVGNDGVTQNTSMFSPDGTHPNPLGCAAMATRFPIDLPWLFDGSRPSGPTTAPSGVCPTIQQGSWVFSQDGHATFGDPVSGNWITKI